MTVLTPFKNTDVDSRGERDRFETRLTILSRKGLQASYPLSDKLEENLYELRLERSPHNPRFLYCALLERQLFILHGFSKTGKKTDKVPESEKRIARQRREILIKRFQEAEKNYLKTKNLLKNQKNLKRGEIMKPKIKPTIGADTLDALEWLASIHEDTPESQAIEEEEWTKYNLAIALIEAREAAGHTQSTLAAELGVQQSLISKWEKVHHNHTLETLLQLCNVTGAKLVMGLEIGGELHAITPAAKRCVLLSETAQQNLEAKAKSVGLTPRETLLAPLVEKEKQPAKRRVPGSQPRLEARGN